MMKATGIQALCYPKLKRAAVDGFLEECYKEEERLYYKLLTIQKIKNMINEKLMKQITVEDLLQMGFIEEHDGTGDPRGTDWNIRNKNFHLWVDPWFEVFLTRVNPDTDQITIHVTDKTELQIVIDWIAD